jgi:hypothetical protein
LKRQLKQKAMLCGCFYSNKEEVEVEKPKTMPEPGEFSRE